MFVKNSVLLHSKKVMGVKAMNGIINIYKEQGFTSHDVVAKLRGILRMKKIGHTGTLDPDAVGVLPVCLGAGTKLCDYITDKSKVYEAVVKLGVETDTQDLSGNILCSKEVTVNLEEVKNAFLSFTGEYNQIPPMYSAVKVNGQRLYELARQGKEIERMAKPVQIQKIEFLRDELEHHELTIRVFCGKGTYIRTLIHDAGQKLGCGAAMKHLIRTQVGGFLIDNSLTLSQVEQLRDEGTLDEKIVPVEQVFIDYPVLHTLEEADRLLLNGNPLKASDCFEHINGQANQFYRINTSLGKFTGLYRYEESRKLYMPEKMFLM